MKTASTNKKIREIIGLVKDLKLIPRPEFQRRLVWTRDDKNHFLDSIIRGYPFPEIYLSDGEVDLETGAGTQLLVDGLQRVSTMIQYFDADPDLKLTVIPNYKDLPDDQKKAFLQYDVAVRDLGSISKEEVIEVFKRINSTKYSLTDIEVNNAVYSGALRKFAEHISLNNFFAENFVFSSLDYKRMGDLRFSLLLIVTIMGGYSNRDDEFEGFLARYNDDFFEKKAIEIGLSKVFEFIEECGFSKKSRIWRKADLFTVVIEMYIALIDEKLNLDPLLVVNGLQNLFDEIDTTVISEVYISGIYYKAALQASNDRLNRLRRGVIVAGIIRGIPREDTLSVLQSMKLI